LYQAVVIYVSFGPAEDNYAPVVYAKKQEKEIVVKVVFVQRVMVEMRVALV
jgi:hypothetical protein